MPTSKQRESLNEIWKILEANSKAIAQAQAMNDQLSDRVLRLRVIPGDISSVTLGVLCQKLTQFYLHLEECVAEVESAESMAKGMRP